MRKLSSAILYGETLTDLGLLVSNAPTSTVVFPLAGRNRHYSTKVFVGLHHTNLLAAPENVVNRKKEKINEIV